MLMNDQQEPRSYQAAKCLIFVDVEFVLHYLFCVKICGGRKTSIESRKLQISKNLPKLRVLSPLDFRR